MGNKLGRRRQVVDEKYTRPQGLYHHRDVDHKKLRKLILDSKLAPCYPGDEESTLDLEECPICFLYYPSLNRSRCCMKGICTECFLQMKTPNSTRPTQCPFCKTLNYAVEYRGVKSKEERGIEQIEEQRVIEAKIRMRQQEIQDEEDRLHKRQDVNSTSRNIVHEEVDYSSEPSSGSPVDVDEIVPSQESASVVRQHLRSRQNRDDEFDLDLEDLMVMEAIWLSVQGGQQRNLGYCDAAVEEHVHDNLSTPMAESSSSPSGGLACAIAALAERQQTTEESSTTYIRNFSGYNTHPCASRFHSRIRQEAEDFPPCASRFHGAVGQVENYPHLQNNLEMPGSGVIGMGNDTGWGMAGAAELGATYASSHIMEDMNVVSAVPPPPNVHQAGFQTMTGPIIPESFEEQMMLAMAVSLAEARARANAQGVAQGVAWQ